MKNIDRFGRFGKDGEGADTVFQILQQKDHPYSNYGSWLLFRLIGPLQVVDYHNETRPFQLSYNGSLDMNGLATELAESITRGETTSNIKSTTACTDIIHYCESVLLENEDFNRKLLQTAQGSDLHSNTDKKACGHLKCFLVSSLHDMKKATISSVESHNRFLHLWDACKSASTSLSYIVGLDHDTQELNKTFVWHLCCSFSMKEEKTSDPDLLSMAASIAFLAGALYPATKSKFIQPRHDDSTKETRNRRATKKRIIGSLENRNAKSIGNDDSSTLDVISLILKPLGPYFSAQNLESKVIRIARFFSATFAPESTSVLESETNRKVFINEMTEYYNKAFQAAVGTKGVQWINFLRLCHGGNEQQRINRAFACDDIQNITFGPNILIRTDHDRPTVAMIEKAPVRRLFTFGSPFIMED
jgi:hypothetical protein